MFRTQLFDKLNNRRGRRGISRFSPMVQNPSTVFSRIGYQKPQNAQQLQGITRFFVFQFVATQRVRRLLATVHLKRKARIDRKGIRQTRFVLNVEVRTMVPMVVAPEEDERGLPAVLHHAADKESTVLRP